MTRRTRNWLGHITEWKPIIAVSRPECTFCGERIEPGETWTGWVEWSDPCLMFDVWFADPGCFEYIAKTEEI